MFRKLPGDEARSLVSTTPDTAVVFKPSVVSTPAIVTIVIALWRTLAGLVRFTVAHPVITLIAGLVGYLWWSAVEWIIPAVAVSMLVSAYVGVGIARPVVFARTWHLMLASLRRFWVYRRHWQPVMIVSGLGRVHRGREFLPKLVKVSCDSHADHVTVKMLEGQSVTDWEKRIDHLAHGFGATSCRIEIVKAGRVKLTFPRKDPLVVPIPALPISIESIIDAVPIGKREDGKVYRLKIHGTHVLIAGATGSGKGSWLWSIVRALLPAKRARLVQIWACDPKRMELSFGKRLFDRYAAKPKDCVVLLEAAAAVMQKRADTFAGIRRSHTPTVEDPFILIIVDEVAFLTAYQSDRDLKRRTEAALSVLTSQGRSVGVGVLAALQDPRKEVMNIRNLFPDKIALRLDESEQVDMVLGDGARDRGALADEISAEPSIGAGVGYVRLESSPEPIRVRAAYVSDDDIRQMETDYAGLHLVDDGGEVA